MVELILDQQHGEDSGQDRLQEALTDQRLAIISAKRLKTDKERRVHVHLAIRDQLFPCTALFRLPGH